MNRKLIYLEQRIKELESLAEEVIALANKRAEGEQVQPELSVKGQRWYRGARELLVQHGFSGLKEFEYQYTNYSHAKETTGIRGYIHGEITFRDVKHTSECLDAFLLHFMIARSLVLSVMDEINSRELPITTELSFHVSTNEFETAKDIFDKYNNEDVFVRVSGIVARVALERHIRTVTDSRNIAIVRNPSNKAHDDFTDVTNTLLKERVITSHQKSELYLLYRTGNECAHPKGKVIASEVKQLIERGRELASAIM